MVKATIFFALLLVSGMFSFEYSIFEFHSTSNKSVEIQYAYADGLSNSDNSTTSQEGAGNSGTGTAGGGSQVNDIISDNGNTGEVGTDNGNTGEVGTDNGNTGEVGTDNGNTGEVGTDNGNTGEVGTDNGNTGEVGTDNGNTGEVGTDNGNTGESIGGLGEGTGAAGEVADIGIGEVGTGNGNGSDVGGVSNVGTGEAAAGQIGEVSTGSGELSNLVTDGVDRVPIGEVSDVSTGSGDTNGPHLGVEILDIDTTPPSQVTGLSASPTGLAWSQNVEVDFDHYNIYRGTSSGFNVIPGVTPPTATTSSNSFQDGGLDPSTPYYYKVAAVDNAGNIGPLSFERSNIGNSNGNSGGGVGAGDTGNEPPGGTPCDQQDPNCPTQVADFIVNVGSESANLNWNQNAESDISHYNIYRGNSSGFTVTPGSTRPIGISSSTGYLDTGLDPSVTYYYRIAAVDNDGNIGPVSPEIFQLAPGPTSVSISSAISPSPGLISLTWSPNTDRTFNHYNIYMGTRNEFTDFGFNVIPGVTPPIGTSFNTTYTISGLDPSGTYRFMVAAVDNAGHIGYLSPFVQDPQPILCGGINSDPSCPGPSPQDIIDTLQHMCEFFPSNSNCLSGKAGQAGGGPFAAAFPGGAVSTVLDGTAQSVSSDPNALFIRPAEGSLSTESICNDGNDNDHNGLVDMKDPNCTASELSDKGQAILSSNASEISHVNLQGHQKLKPVQNGTFIEDQLGFLSINQSTKLSPHHDIRTSLFFAKQTFR